MAVPHDGIDNFIQHWLFLQYRLVSTLINDLIDHLDFIFMEILEQSVEGSYKILQCPLSHLYVSFLH
ncbi:hypothetical protein [uncultured Muribaculum sp.]|uniref:hypothetical protein n=1 Tax=uncultured Muribaculum sp. TaxID=1918613 RepID=UPI0025B5B79C|nr:hypothetical protein [uncultured Muribaculum sp.]